MSDTPPSPPRFAWDWAGAWTGVFAINLPVPLLCAWGAVWADNWIGLVGGLALLYWLGLAVCGFRYRIGRSLVWGGLLIATSQVFPLLQVGSVIVAVKVWDGVVGASSWGDGITHRGDDPVDIARTNLGIFVVVLLTAQPLMVLSILLGAGIRVYKRDRPIWFTPRTDPDAELEPTTEPAP